MSIPARATWSFGSRTATAGTAFNYVIPPRGSPNSSHRLRTVVTTFIYVSGSAQHTLTLLRPFGTTTVNAAAASGQKHVNLVTDPGAAPKGPDGTLSLLAPAGIAGNDWLIFETPGGEYYWDTVNSVSITSVGNPAVTTTTITMTNNLPTNGLAAGANCWLMKSVASAAGDVYTGLPYETWLPTVSVTTTFDDIENGIFSGYAPYQPLMIVSNNLTTAGSALWISGVYSLI
jgi:hypothetical protein